MNYPTLYKRTSTGATQQWQIEVIPHQMGGIIKTRFGQVDGEIQTTSDIITGGKNIGRSNQTTALEQADAEAQGKWEKKVKSGYVEDIDKAKAGKDDVTGGMLPMLAFTYEKQGHKLKFPGTYAQKKMDGTRCVCIFKDGKATLWSRTRKPINSMPHIIAEIEANLKEDVVLDGELFADHLKANFEQIVHLVRQDSPDKEHKQIAYHVYDIIGPGKFTERNQQIKELFASNAFEHLKEVETTQVMSEDDIPDVFIKYRDQGHEGAMLRNGDGLYVGKRSADLIKVKEMADDEFLVISIEEGRGRLQGHVGAFVCQIGDQTFKAKMSGSTERLKDYFEDHSLWAGKLLTVQYQSLTSYGIPRFPVGLRLRDSEDY